MIYETFLSHYDGIGPTEEDCGVPLALRSTVDKPKDWYKSMFKAMHKAKTGGGVENMTDYDTDYTFDEDLLQKPQIKIRMNPGSISKFTSGSAYVSENQPVPSMINNNLRERRPSSSARGESAKEAVAEITSKPWKEYFDDCDSGLFTKNL